VPVPSSSHPGLSSIDDTLTRLARLGQQLAARRHGVAVQRARLLAESERALHHAHTRGSGLQQLVTERILSCPRTYGLWESQHLRLLERIAEQPHRARQAASVLSSCFSLVHAKSLFDYLRESRAAGPRRRRLIAHFHGSSGFSSALVSEHGAYLRSMASLLCLRHLGAHVIRHSAFGEPILHYERSYAEYYRAYCQWAVPERAGADADAMKVRQQQLKKAVLIARRRLLAMPLRPDPPR
jgi:hypothetical protein